MFALKEYQSKTHKLQDHIPWAGLVHPSVVLNKDGSFMRTIRLRSPDLESSGDNELVALHARINDVFRRLGSGWALFFDSERIAVSRYPTSEFPDPVSKLVDLERKAQFEEGDHFENITTLSLLWLPPQDKVAGVSSLFLNDSTDNTQPAGRVLEQFLSETDKVIGLLSGILSEVSVLCEGDYLTYLHGTISNSRYPVALPEIPFYLDGLLVDEPLSGGLSPRLGDSHLKLVTITGFPGSSVPGILNGLNQLGFEYRFMSRFLSMDKMAATRELTKYRRQWFAKRKGIGSILKEVMTNEVSPLVDSDAENKAVDVDVALQELGSDDVAYGYVTLTVLVKDHSPDSAEEKIKAVERVIGGAGFVTIRETVNAVEAWLGMMPGHVYANIRRFLISSLNLTHLLPVSDQWAGPVVNSHLAAPPLMICNTASHTLFRLVHHVGDVGHMMMLGPTGAGKSVLLAFMMMQFLRYQNAQVFVFDKGASCRASILAMRGDFYDLGKKNKTGLSFQPLARIDNEADCRWAQDWLLGLLAEQGFAITPAAKEQLWQALNNLASAPQGQRTLTGLSLLLQNQSIREALRPYTLEGPYGTLLDSDHDTLDVSDLQAFEMEALQPGAVLPVLTYLFKRLEECFTGNPTLLVLDEAWLFLDSPIFAGKIREWLKVLRKKNVSVVFATQSLADVASSAIAPVLVESCPSRIFLPNVRASEPAIRSIYEAFGLSDRQIQLIAGSAPKQDYYLQSPSGNRLFDLGLGPVALAFSGASSPQDQKLISSIVANHGLDGFAAEWLKTKDLDWAAELLETPTLENPHA